MAEPVQDARSGNDGIARFAIKTYTNREMESMNQVSPLAFSIWLKSSSKLCLMGIVLVFLTWKIMS